jgi:hypothetical protein
VIRVERVGDIPVLLAKPADAFVSVAGLGRKMHIVLREQLAKNVPRNLAEQSEKIIDELVAGRTVADPPAQGAHQSVLPECPAVPDLEIQI